MDGILPVYKPAGIMSYDVIRAFKKETAFLGKVGHGGTLDPFAEGVLLLLLGKATRQFDAIRGWHKTYRATALLGASSDTLDRTGKISMQYAVSSIAYGKEEMQMAADAFIGEIEQQVPKYSAAKVAGKPRYIYARKGEEVAPVSKRVTVYSLSIDTVEKQRVTFTAEVGSGTYIRQLSYDLFTSLGIESYLESLVREQLGEVSLSSCCRIEQFRDDSWKTYLLP